MLEYSKKTIYQTSQHVVYTFLFEAVQYPATKKVKQLTEKSIINYCLAKIIGIIDRLLVIVKK